MKMPIIALGRQFGSGGREIGKRLAEKLNIRCYDRELITLAAQKAELREELFAGREEKAPNPWLFTGVYEGGPQVRKGQPAEDILFEMQSQVILELAQKDPCIIVGRCADAILKSAGIPVISLFICAPFGDRIRRRMEIEGLGPKEAEDTIRKIDKQRKKYYDTYTGRNWGVPEVRRIRNMKMPIIALGRQFGSGGREIGKRLAEKLNIRCYDRELITLAAQKAELREELFAGREEKAPNPWLFTGVYEGGPQVRKGQPAEDILFEMQSQVILELAQKDPCIIVGRCADAILKSAGIPVISLFICAPFGDRIRRRMEIEGLGPKEAEDTIRKIDKQRKKYYDTYTGRNWGVPENYDFCINSSVMGIEETAEHIITWTRGNW